MDVEIVKQEQQKFNKEGYLKKEILKPQQSVLLVVDVQNDFCDPKGKFAGWGRNITQMQNIVPHIQELIDSAHRANVPVIFTQGFEDVKFRKGPDLLRAKVIGEDDNKPETVNSLKGTFGAEFYQFKPEEKDIVIEKNKWSAFDGKDKDGKTLKQILDHLETRTLVITGVMAETCIETTIRDAYNQDYFVIIPENSVGSDSQEQLQTRMKYWNRGFVGNVVSEELIKESWSPTSQ